MITRFPRSGYYRPLEHMTTYDLYRYSQRGEAEAREAERARERKRAIRQEAEQRLQEAGLGSMTHEELTAYARRGRTEDILAAAEKLRRWRRSEQVQSNVVEFRQRRSDNGGVA